MDNMVDSDSDISIEESDDDQSLNFNVSHNNNNGYLTDHKVLSTQQVYSLMEDEMKKVQDVVVALSGSKTRSLLNKFKWDGAKLLETILEDNKNINELMKISWEYAGCDVRKLFECQICFDEIVPVDIFKLNCNHRFCRDCLKSYFSSTIKDGGLLETAIICPGFKCKFELEDDFVIKLLEDKKLKAKYLQIIANSFVQNNRFMKWCPNPSCQRAVELESFDKSLFRESVRCDCGIYFCFKCHELSHDPIDCSLIIKWAKIKAEDFEVRNWILRNTKPCPKCQVNIQKNGGCMHITCKCKYEFCWVCMGLWRSRHNCDQSDGVKPTVDGLKNIRRFGTYNAKQATMKQAYDLDVTQYKDKLEQGTTELELEKQWVKIEFVSQAVEILLQCRRTLMHAYIFSYFMTTINNQMDIFEENLKFLEQCTEQLSEVLENDVTASNVGKMKERIIDFSALCEKRKRNLMDHIIEGYDENWWRKFPISVEELLAAEMAVGEDVIHELLY